MLVSPSIFLGVGIQQLHTEDQAWEDCILFDRKVVADEASLEKAKVVVNRASSEDADAG